RPVGPRHGRGPSRGDRGAGDAHPRRRARRTRRAGLAERERSLARRRRPVAGGGGRTDAAGAAGAAAPPSRGPDRLHRRRLRPADDGGRAVRRGGLPELHGLRDGGGGDRVRLAAAAHPHGLGRRGGPARGRRRGRGRWSLAGGTCRDGRPRGRGARRLLLRAWDDMPMSTDPQPPAVQDPAAAAARDAAVPLPEGVALGTAHGVDAVLVDTSAATGVLLLDGAHLPGWVPAGGEDLLWMSPSSEFGPGVAVRGGVPLVGPW